MNKDINVRNYDNLSWLLGMEKDGSINLKESYMQCLLNDMLKALPGIIELQAVEPAAQNAVNILGQTASVFQKVLKELS